METSPCDDVDNSLIIHYQCLRQWHANVLLLLVQMYSEEALLDMT